MGWGSPGSPVDRDRYKIPHPQRPLQPRLMYWHGPKLPTASFREKTNNGALYLTLCAVGNGDKTNGPYLTT